MLVFARFLSAEDFGIFAAATLAMGFASTFAESRHGHQRLVDLHTDQLVLDAPLEHSTDALYIFVDHPSRDIRADHGFSDRLELQRAEVIDGSAAVELADKTKCRTDASLFIGGLTIFDVVRLTPALILSRYTVSRVGRGQSPSRGLELVVPPRFRLT